MVISASLLDVAVIAGAGLVLAVIAVADNLLVTLIALALLPLAVIAVADNLLVAVITVALVVLAASVVADNEVVPVVITVADLRAAEIVLADNAVAVGASIARSLGQAPHTEADDDDVGGDREDGGGESGQITASVGECDSLGDNAGASDSSSDGGSANGISDLVDGEENAGGDLSSGKTALEVVTTAVEVGVTGAGNGAAVRRQLSSLTLIESVATVAVGVIETEELVALTGGSADLRLHVVAGELEAEAIEGVVGAEAALEVEASDGRVGAGGAGASGSGVGLSARDSAGGGDSTGDGVSAGGSASEGHGAGHGAGGESLGTSEGLGVGLGRGEGLSTSGHGRVVGRLSEGHIAQGKGEHGSVTHLDGFLFGVLLNE